MAVQYATYLYNKIPDPSTGLCPDDLFTKTQWEQWKFHDLHVWGCPLYILGKAFSDGKKLPCWKHGASQEIFMGLSPDHASTVPLVLNLDTRAITPQFHVVFDDWFTTVTTSVDDLQDFNSGTWSKMFIDSEYQIIGNEDDTQVDSEDSMTSEAITTRQNQVSKAMDMTMPPTPLPVSPPPKEITQLESKDTWVEVPTSEATSKILPGTWVFHHKRATTGIITKFKARYCVRGDLQEDIPETDAPVVSWCTIRLVLVFTLTQK